MLIFQVHLNIIRYISILLYLLLGDDDSSTQHIDLNIRHLSFISIYLFVCLLWSIYRLSHIYISGHVPTSESKYNNDEEGSDLEEEDEPPLSSSVPFNHGTTTTTTTIDYYG
jgi:hypothetical protein